MANIEGLVEILGVITFLAGFTQLFLRINYLRRFESNIPGNHFFLVFGIWLPLKLNQEDSIEQTKHKKMINTSLRFFYILLIFLFIELLIS